MDLISHPKKQKIDGPNHPVGAIYFQIEQFLKKKTFFNSSQSQLDREHIRYTWYFGAHGAHIKSDTSILDLTI
jgi:hypothetical protein